MPADKGVSEPNFDTFRECFSSAVLVRVSRPEKKTPRKRIGRKNAIKPVQAANAAEDTDGEELGEFIEFLASEIFPSLPPPLQTLNYSTVQASPGILDTWASLTPSTIEETILPLLPPSVPESISTYSFLPPSTSLTALLDATLTAYVSATTSSPPVWSTTRTEGCEICERDWIPLTYHHLIPRSTHDRVLKRGWHEEWELNKVAWLCRACHSFVHRIATNEELAKEWSSVEALMEREDVKSWARWVGRVRWKAR